MTLSNVTNGLADSCATITARRPERFVAVGQGASSARYCVGSFLRGRWLPCALKFAFFSWAGRPTIGIHGHKKTGLLWKSAQISFLT